MHFMGLNERNHSQEKEDAFEAGAYSETLRIKAFLGEKYTNAMMSKENSKPRSHEHQFFAGYLAAIEEIIESIDPDTSSGQNRAD